MIDDLNFAPDLASVQKTSFWRMATCDLLDVILFLLNGLRERLFVIASIFLVYIISVEFSKRILSQRTSFRFRKDLQHHSIEVSDHENILTYNISHLFSSQARHHQH